LDVPRSRIKYARFSEEAWLGVGAAWAAAERNLSAVGYGQAVLDTINAKATKACYFSIFSLEGTADQFRKPEIPLNVSNLLSAQHFLTPRLSERFYLVLEHLLKIQESTMREAKRFFLFPRSEAINTLHAAIQQQPLGSPGGHHPGFNHGV